MELFEILAYFAVAVLLVLRVAMLAAFILLPLAVLRMIRRSAAAPRRAPAAK